MIEKIAVGWEAPVNDEYRTILQMVKESDNIVFFGGAGVSTESGILISAVWMVFTTRNMTIRRRRF